MRAASAALVIFVLALACGHAPLEGEEPEQAPADPIEEVEWRELFDQGVELARAGDLVRAEQYLASSVTRGAPQAEVLPALLRVCVAARRYRVALGYADPYLAEHPDDWSLRFLVASIHLGMGDVVEARRELEQVIEDEPAQADPHYLLAIVLRDEVGDPSSAESHFRRYLDLAPEGRHAAEVTHALTRIRVDMPAPGTGDPTEGGPAGSPGRVAPRGPDGAGEPTSTEESP